MAQKRENRINEKGFTLVELMVTVFLTAIAVISIYRGYTSFSQAADAQQQIMEMQQNLRIGMTWLAADIRRAGMNIEDEDAAGFVYVGYDPAADKDEGCTNDLHDYTNPDDTLADRAIVFTMDLVGTGYDTDCVDNDGDGIGDRDGTTCAFDPDPDVAALEAVEGAQELLSGDGDVLDAGERVKYSLQVSGDTYDLLRSVWDSSSNSYDTVTLITNVEALNFRYFDDTDIELTPSVALDTDGDGVDVLVLSKVDAAKVDRVEITMVVQTTNEDYRFTDTSPYWNMRGDTVVFNAADPEMVDPDSGDSHKRRRAFSMSVQIRNNI
jgi:prepilin-type N-terminal cleavage/methylation domain-containing protein